MISVQPLQRADLGLLAAWLAEPLVQRWWAEDPAAVERGFADHPDAHDVVVPVHADNRASWRALEKAGFTRVAEGDLEPDDPADTRDHVVYRRHRGTSA
jgi:RimJ/RimL family protein N-acetyltransferase